MKRLIGLATGLFRKDLEYASPVLILLAGAAFSVLLFIYLDGVQRERIRDDFEDYAVERVNGIQDGIRANIVHLEAIRAFFSASRLVERGEFHKFVKPFLEEERGIHALEWIPRVAAADRRSYEQDARREGLSGFSITEKGPGGEMMHAGVRSEYYPVYYLEPYKENEPALGFDLASEAARRKTMEQARDTGVAVATGPIRLIQERGDGRGMLVFLPFYRDGAAPQTVEDRRRNLQGFILGVFRIDDVIGRALAPWKNERDTVHVRIYDVTSSQRETLIFDSFPLRSGAEKKDIERGIYYKAAIDVDGRRWSVLCLPSPRFIAKEQQFHPLGFLIAGFVLTMMVSFHAFNAVQRRREIRRHARDLGISREALRESEGRFRRLAENAQDIIYRYEFLPERRFSYVSPAVTTITGYTPDELYADALLGLKIVHPDDRGPLQQYLGGPCLPRQPLTVRWIRRDGTVIWIEQHNVPIFSDSGKLIAIEGIARDITERKRAQEALERAAVEWTAAMDAYDDAVYLLDLDRRLVLANKTFYAMVGSDPLTAVGRHITEIVHPGGETVACPVCRAQEERRDEIIIMEADNPDNPAGKPIQVTIRMVRGREGHAQSILMSLHSLSHDRQLHEEKGRIEEQLRQAQKMETVGQLAGGVAHDFNNILSAIVGYAQLTLMKTREDDPLRHNIEQILEASNRAAVLTHGLLTFSRRQPVNLAPLEVNALLARFEKFIRRLIREDIALQTRFTGEALPVLADAGQMEQVIMNLVTNARDAMPRGGILTVETGRTLIDDAFVAAHGYGTAGEYAMIAVSDTGVGMDEMTRRRIFEPFFTTKEVGKGTGLGLAMAYGIVKKHEGFINAYSEVGRGTTFRLYLPLAQAADQPKERMIAEPPVRGGNETILLAEDDDALRRLAVTVLTQYGYTVIDAADGEDAVRKFTERQDDIRLVILDCIMPKKNGRAVYEEISRLRPGVKAVFASGYSEDVFTKDGIPETAFFIRKPLMPNDLLRTVREMLDM